MPTVILHNAIFDNEIIPPTCHTLYPSTTTLMEVHTTNKTIIAMSDIVARIVFLCCLPNRVATALKFCKRCQTC